MKIHTMIAEDELLAREELIYLLDREKDVKLLPSAESGEQLVALYKEHEPDVIFLDVHMPGMRGVEAAKKIIDIAYVKAPLFVFTTAYDDYAVEAFEIEAIDYMLKPYDTERFQIAMNRIRKRMQQLERKDHQLFHQGINSTTKLLIDDNDRTVVLSPDAIYYAVPYKRMLEIHTEEKVIYSRMTLQELEKKLQGFAFFRAHRSYLVNLNHVQEITPWFNGASNITLRDNKKTTIPVSRSARKQLFDLFGN
ncbi:LytTR family DNA-binding domain-containing protein [Oceanobacillus sp. J11TS1]|uniref:LytR/AlgR family response regulator transcription factor n=1 Tax=Oceanobacillus sp. J11TS1 TaxID=2807191 RepID=UPI001B0A1253|nr:LytTR family DNA-binding domain-containing protein [Oceanobacillus sp. J11TS1]GIO22121.1 DNA-binding response regulator [Oceanobacillus sp. J11TS1]